MKTIATTPARFRNPTSIIIDRALWLDGRAEAATGLDGTLRDRGTGLMCCLGFVGKACGVTHAGLNDKAFVSSVLPEGHPLKYALDEGGLVDLNDHKATPCYIREAALKRKFKQGGLSVTFRGRRQSKKALRALVAKGQGRA